MDGSQAWPAIRSGIEKVRALAGDLAVAVVANLKSVDAPKSDYANTSVATEYFSENEASQIMFGLQENGFYTKFYNAELELILAVLNGEFDRVPRDRKLVYNVAQSGIGPGRKSLIPAFCRLRGIAVCNSDAYVVSLARHKFHVHCILRSLGIPTAESWLYHGDSGWLMGRSPPTGVPLIAKACYESASIGLTRRSVGVLSKDYEAFLAETSNTLQQPVIVQRFIAGYEVEVPVVELSGRPVALDPVSITLDSKAMLDDQFLDYHIVEFDDYGFASSDHLNPDVLKAVQAAAESTFVALGISSIGRVDFRVNAHDWSIAITDVATSPHLVKHSAFAFSFQQAGLSHVDLFAAMVAANACRLGWIH